MHRAEKTETHQEENTNQWTGTIETIGPSLPSAAYFSALGTTRAKAGGVAEQRKIDYDLNLALAQAAKKAGIGCFVLISATGTWAKAPMMPYVAMKGQMEEAAIALGFPHLVIVKPGLLLGERTEKRPAEAVARTIASSIGRLSHHLTDFWAQDAAIVAKAAVAAARQCLTGQRPAGVWYLSQQEIVRLGRTEWTGT